METAKQQQGRIFDIQRFCTSDGPGIRTVVFFQGCALKCPWCHNPESRPAGPLVAWSAARCIGCGQCRAAGYSSSCRFHPEKSCSGCGECVSLCPGGALTLLGRSVTAREVMAVVERDADFYQSTGGGLTLSGGEPLLQPDFAAALLSLARESKINTAIETSGSRPWAVTAKLLPLCDLWLFDIKCHWDRCRELTGAAPEIIKDNLQRLSDSGAAIRLRVPAVEGWNYTPELLELLQELRQLPGVEAVDILPFHNLGRGKATSIGQPEAPWDTMSAPER